MAASPAGGSVARAVAMLDPVAFIEASERKDQKREEGE